VRAVPARAYWRSPYRWNRRCAAEGRRERVFCSSLADVFEDWPGPMSDYLGTPLTHPGEDSRPLRMADVRARLFDVIDDTPWLDWLLLSKRPENVRRMWADTGRPDGLRKNVWLGTSPCDQATAEVALPRLLAARDLSPVLFLSAEPLIGPLDLRPWLSQRSRQQERRPDWVIVGGESGPGARPCDPAWVESLIDQCRAADIPLFVKQLGKHNGLALDHKKGGDPEEWPSRFRVRQLP
jgi:protein gp37